MNHILKITLATILGIFVSAQASAGSTVKELMNEYYSVFDEDTNCRYVINDEEYDKYCMTLEKAEIVNTRSGKRMYIVMTGDLETGSHASSGMVGIFILAPDGENKWKVVSSKSKIELGSWGIAPDEWSFHKFAPNKWGFLTESHESGGDSTASSYNIFTAKGNSIRESWLISSGSYSVCGDRGIKCYEISSKIKINTNKVINDFYTLTLTVNGKGENGKRYKNRKYRATFKNGKGYTTPKNYPIK